MVTKKQINKLANKARGGCVESRDEILSFFTPIIMRESMKLRNIVDDESRFEWCCYREILRMINCYDENVKSFYNVVYKRIKTISSRNFKRHKINRSLISSIDIIGFDKSDVLADVESEFFAREKVANLAGSDLRKKIILNAWMDGCTCTKEISGLLADKLGGKQETHRKFILRFKEKCKQALDGAA